MPIKAVIWDIGGVIMRTEDQAPRAELADELGVTRAYLNELVFDGEQGTRAQIGEISRMELWDYVRSELQLAPGEYPDLNDRFFGGDVLDTDLVPGKAGLVVVRVHDVGKTRLPGSLPDIGDRPGAARRDAGVLHASQQRRRIDSEIQRDEHQHYRADTAADHLWRTRTAPVLDVAAASAAFPLHA